MSEEPVISNVAGFFELDEDAVSKIDENVLLKLNEKAQAFRKVQSDNLKISAALDQLKSQSDSKLETFKNQIDKLIEEIEHNKQERIEFEGERKQLIDEKSAVLLKNNELTQLLNVQKQQKELLEASKQDLTRLFEDKNTDLTNSKAKIEELLETNKDLRKQLLEVENDLQTHKTNELREKSSSLRMEQELSLLKNNTEWLTKELETKNQEFHKLRGDLTKDLHASLARLSQLESELEIASNTNIRLKETVNDLQNQLQEKLSENKKIKDELSFEKLEFTKEMSLKQRMIDALEKHMKALKQEMESTKQTIQTSNFTEEDVKNLTDELNDVKHELKISETTCMKLNETVDQLTSNVKSNETEVGNLTNTSETSVSVIPKLYGDVGLLKKQLIVERRQKDELKLQVEAFVIELEHKIPVLNSFKERTEMLERELNEVTLLLESTGKDREDKANQLEYLQSTLKSYESQIRSLTKQRTDLARQVQYLLIDQSIRSGNNGPLNADELKFVQNLINSENGTKDSDTQSVITERLVEFKSIIDLQKKNSELLITIRKLADELENQEAENRSKIQVLEDSTVKEAKETILALHDHAQNLENQLSLITKERDVYKSLSSGNDSVKRESPRAITYPSPDENSKVKDLEVRLMSVIEEAENNSKEWSAENNSLRKKFHEISLQFESEKTSRTLAEDRLSLLQSTLNLSKSECEELKKRSSHLQDVLMEQDRRTQDTFDSLIKTKSDLASMQSEVTILKSERDFLRKIEKTLKKENEQLSKESLESKVLIAQLQSLQRERDSLLKETQKSFKEKINALESELATVREKLQEKSKESEKSLSNKTTQYKWFQEKIDSLNAEVKAARTLADEKEVEIDQLNSQLRQQSAKLQEAEARAQSYTLFTSTDDSHAQFEALRQELEKSTLQLSEAYSQIDHFKDLAEKSNSDVTELSETFQKAQKSSEDIISSLEKERDQLQHTVNILNDQIDDLNNELNHQRAQYENDKNNLQKRVDELLIKEASLDKIKKEYEENLSRIQNDLTMQTNFANEAQKNYETELQKHADVSKTITSLRTEAQSYKAELEVLQSQTNELTTTLKNNEQLWQEQKTELENQLTSAVQRIEDLSTQNNLLYDQLELLNKSQSEDYVGESNDLLISLRRERDVLETKLEVAVSEKNIIRQRLEIVKSDLENSNMQLAQLQNSSDESSKLIKEHEKIMEQLNQVNLLRESNITLRNENKKSIEDCEKLKNQLQSYEEKITPLEASLSSLENALKIKDQELSLSKEETERWKKRSQDILHKYERIDPEEHSKLMDDISNVKDELFKTKEDLQKVMVERDDWESKFQRIKNQARERLNASKEKEHSLYTEISELKDAKSQVENSLDMARKNISQLENSIETMKQQTALQEQTYEATMAKLQQELTASEEKLNLLKSDDSVNTESSKEVDSLNENIASLQQKIKSMEEELEQAREKLKEGQTKVIEEATPAIVEKLRAEFEQEKEKFIENKEAELRRKFELEKVQFVREKEEEYRKQLELKEQEIKNQHVNEISDEVNGSSIDIEKLKKDWEKEYEEHTLQRIKEAEEALKKRIRLPTQQKIDKIVEARKAVLEETFEERINAKAQQLAQDKGKNEFSLQEHKNELEELKASLQKQFEATLTDVKQKAFEEGKQQVSLKIKFLEGKIKNLEKEKASSDVSSTSQVPVFGTQQLPVNPFASNMLSPFSNKRNLEEDNDQPDSSEKRKKEEGS